MSIKIFQGQQKVFKLKIRLGSDNEPIDLNAFDLFKVCLPTNGAVLEITETINTNGSIVAISGTAESGNLEVTLNYVDSATLKIGERQDIGVLLDNSTIPNPQPMIADGVLSVVAAIC